MTLVCKPADTEIKNALVILPTRAPRLAVPLPRCGVPRKITPATDLSSL